MQASPAFSEFKAPSILKNNTFGGGSYAAGERPSAVSGAELSRVQAAAPSDNMRPSRPDESLMD